MPPKAAYVYWSDDRLLAFFWLFGVEAPVACAFMAYLFGTGEQASRHQSRPPDA